MRHQVMTSAYRSAILLGWIVLLAAGCNSSGASNDAAGAAGAGGNAGSGGAGGSAGTSGGGGGAAGQGGSGGSAGGQGNAGTTGSAGMDGGAGGRGGAGGNDGSCSSNSDCQGVQVCYVGVNSCGTSVGGHCVTRLPDGCSWCACLDIVSGSCPAGQGGRCFESGVAGGCWYCALPI